MCNSAGVAQSAVYDGLEIRRHLLSVAPTMSVFVLSRLWLLHLPVYKASLPPAPRQLLDGKEQCPPHCIQPKTDRPCHVVSTQSPLAISSDPISPCFLSSCFMASLSFWCVFLTLKYPHALAITTYTYKYITKGLEKQISSIYKQPYLLRQNCLSRMNCSL